MQLRAQTCLHVSGTCYGRFMFNKTLKHVNCKACCHTSEPLPAFRFNISPRKCFVTSVAVFLEDVRYAVGILLSLLTDDI
jgi:hypothetical protein